MFFFFFHWPRLCLAGFINGIFNIYLAFMTVSSWFPRFKNTPPGNTNKHDSSNSSTSRLFFPRSTKSPLKQYGFSGDGRPFWNGEKLRQVVWSGNEWLLVQFWNGKCGGKMSLKNKLTLWKTTNKSSNFPCKSPQMVTCLDIAVDAWFKFGRRLSRAVASFSIPATYLACSRLYCDAGEMKKER